MENKTIIHEEFEITRGYTGEDGFELYLSKDRGKEITDYLVDKSLNENNGVSFGGLIERDILRQKRDFVYREMNFQIKWE